jgi:hypothetical protein
VAHHAIVDGEKRVVWKQRSRVPVGAHSQQDEVERRRCGRTRASAKHAHELGLVLGGGVLDRARRVNHMYVFWLDGHLCHTYRSSSAQCVRVCVCVCVCVWCVCMCVCACVRECVCCAPRNTPCQREQPCTPCSSSRRGQAGRGVRRRRTRATCPSQYPLQASTCVCVCVCV